jgi:hypothetical protein
MKNMKRIISVFTMVVMVMGIVPTATANPTVPSAPQNFTVEYLGTSGGSIYRLRWNPPVNNGGTAITRYEVSLNDGATWVTASSNAEHIFTAFVGFGLYFRVRAVNNVGNGAVAFPTNPLVQISIPSGVNNYVFPPTRQGFQLVESEKFIQGADVVPLVVTIHNTSTVETGELFIPTAGTTDGRPIYEVSENKGCPSSITFSFMSISNVFVAESIPAGEIRTFLVYPRLDLVANNPNFYSGSVSVVTAGQAAISNLISLRISIGPHFSQQGLNCIRHICGVCNPICEILCCEVCNKTCDLHICEPCNRSCKTPDCSYCNIHISNINTTENGGWLEITNPADNAVSTKGLYLSASPSCDFYLDCLDCEDIDYFQWQMPSVIIRAGQTVRIRADSNTIDVALKRMNTNFNIDFDDKIRLTCAKGEVISIFEVE